MCKRASHTAHKLRFVGNRLFVRHDAVSGQLNIIRHAQFGQFISLRREDDGLIGGVSHHNVAHTGRKRLHLVEADRIHRHIGWVNTACE